MSLTGPSNQISREISLPEPLVLADNPELQSSLKENQKLTVKVIAVSGDKVVLNIGGKAVFAKTNLPLQVGSTLTVEVRQVQQFPITLSLLASQMPATIATSETSLADLLSMIGQTSTPLAKGLVKELLEGGVPLDENKIREALNMISSMEKEPLAIKGTAFLMQHDLPINASVLKRVMAYLAARETLGHDNPGNENPVADLVKAVHNFLSEMQHTEMQHTEPINNLPVPINTTSVLPDKIQINLENILKQIEISTGSDTKTLTPQISRIIQEATTGVEAKLLAIVKAETDFFLLMEDLIENNNLPQELQQKLQVLEKNLASILKTNNDDLPDLRSIIINNTAEDNIPEKILQNLIKQSGELNTLHRDLATIASKLRPTLSSLASQIKEILQAEAPFQQSPSAISNLNTTIQKTLMHAEGEQLVNLALSSHPEQPQIIVSLPIGYPPGALPGELRIYSQPGKTGGQINPKNVKLGFILNTENIGKLSIFLDIKDNNINGQLSVERGEIQEFLENHIYILRDKLKDLAYNVGNIAVKIGKPDILPIITKSTDLTEITKIDIRV